MSTSKTKNGETRDVHFNCPAELSKKLRLTAALEDTTVTALIVAALEAYLSSFPPAEGH